MDLHELFSRASNKDNYRASCTLKTCPIRLSYYNYLPSLAANGTFLALFAFSLCCFLLQVGLSRRFIGFTIAMVSGCVLEVLGYVGRIMSWYNPFGQVRLLYHTCKMKPPDHLILSQEWFPNADRLPYNCSRLSSRRHLPHTFPYCHGLWPRELPHQTLVLPSNLHTLRCDISAPTSSRRWSGIRCEPLKQEPRYG